MWRGTTPVHRFTLPEGMSGNDFEVLYITYSQNSHTVLEKEKAQIQFRYQHCLWQLLQWNHLMQQVPQSRGDLQLLHHVQMMPQ